MRFLIRAHIKDPAGWDRFWLGLRRLPDLGLSELEKIAGAARLGIGDNFARERTPKGAAWVPLAKHTQRIRKRGIDHRQRPFRVGPKHPILVRTKDLRQSFENPSHPRNVTNVQRSAGFIQVTLGAEDDPETPDRIKILHSGGKTPTGRRVPARPFIGLRKGAMERVDRTARFVLDERVKRL